MVQDGTGALPYHSAIPRTLKPGLQGPNKDLIFLSCRTPQSARARYAEKECTGWKPQPLISKLAGTALAAHDAPRQHCGPFFFLLWPFRRLCLNIYHLPKTVNCRTHILFLRRQPDNLETKHDEHSLANAILCCDHETLFNTLTQVEDLDNHNCQNNVRPGLSVLPVRSWILAPGMAFLHSYIGAA